MSSSEVKNLEAISKAIDAHNAACEWPAVAIEMNPFEVERLGWGSLRGAPIRGTRASPPPPPTNAPRNCRLPAGIQAPRRNADAMDRCSTRVPPIPVLKRNPHYPGTGAPLRGKDSNSRHAHRLA